MHFFCFRGTQVALVNAPSLESFAYSLMFCITGWLFALNAEAMQLESTLFGVAVTWRLFLMFWNCDFCGLLHQARAVARC